MHHIYYLVSIIIVYYSVIFIVIIFAYFLYYFIYLMRIFDIYITMQKYMHGLVLNYTLFCFLFVSISFMILKIFLMVSNCADWKQYCLYFLCDAIVIKNQRIILYIDTLIFYSIITIILYIIVLALLFSYLPFIYFNHSFYPFYLFIYIYIHICHSFYSRHHFSLHPHLIIYYYQMYGVPYPFSRAMDSNTTNWRAQMKDLNYCSHRPNHPIIRLAY